MKTLAWKIRGAMALLVLAAAAVGLEGSLSGDGLREHGAGIVLFAVLAAAGATTQLTGNEKTDFANNRTKRIFDDPVGRRCGEHEHTFLLQTYRRDTGEIVHDISAPIYVKEKHWGGFRIGYGTEF